MTDSAASTGRSPLDAKALAEAQRIADEAPAETPELLARLRAIFDI